MARFIEDVAGRLINTDEIIYIFPNKDGHRATITGKHDRWECYAAQLKSLYPVIPAQPGFSLLSIWFERDDEVPAVVEAHRTPIIAWRISEFGALDPITLSDETSADVQAIQLPDGIIEEQESGTYETMTAFIDDVRHRWQAHIDRKTKKSAAKKAG